MVCVGGHHDIGNQHPRAIITILPLFYLTCRHVPGPPLFLRVTLKNWKGLGTRLLSPALQPFASLFNSPSSVLTPTSRVGACVFCSTADPSPEPSLALKSSRLGLICFTIDLLGVDVVTLVGRQPWQILSRNFIWSKLSSMRFVEVPATHSTVGIYWQNLSSNDMDPLL